jgi:hypothetical protein
VIVAVPALNPETTPEMPTAATATEELVHVPPRGDPVRVTEDPTHTLLVPEIVWAFAIVANERHRTVSKYNIFILFNILFMINFRRFQGHIL